MENKFLPAVGDHFMIDDEEFVLLSDTARQAKGRDYIYSSAQGLHVFTTTREYIATHAQPVEPDLRHELKRMAVIAGLTGAIWLVCAAIAGVI